MTKVISLSDEAYERLKRLKKGKKSFSKVVLDLTEKKDQKSILDCMGAWKGDEKEMKEIFDEILAERSKHHFRTVNL